VSLSLGNRSVTWGKRGLERIDENVRRSCRI
jgi:hypothetical protein